MNRNYRLIHLELKGLKVQFWKIYLHRSKQNHTLTRVCAEPHPNTDDLLMIQNKPTVHT